MGRVEEAFTHLDEAHAAEPEDMIIICNLAAALSAIGWYIHTNDYLDLILSYEPDNFMDLEYKALLLTDGP